MLPKGGGYPTIPNLVEPTVFLFLAPDVLADGFLIRTDRTDCRDIVPSCPEMLPREILPAASVSYGDVDVTLALDEPNHLYHLVFGRDLNQHVYMVWHQMPFQYLTFLLHGQVP